MSVGLVESAPTRLTATGAVTHLALWSPLLHQTRCGVPFDPTQADEAERVEDPVSCMTCLIRVDTYEIPLVGLMVDEFGDAAYFKKVFGSPHNRVTACCAAECPCDWHEQKELP